VSDLISFYVKKKKSLPSFVSAEGNRIVLYIIIYLNYGVNQPYFRFNTFY